MEISLTTMALMSIDENGEYIDGTVATYICVDERYKLIGQAQRTCHRGEFTGSEPNFSQISELI